MILLSKWCWDNWISTCKRMNVDPYFKACTKINSKWIKDLHVRAKTIKLLKNNIGINFCDLGSSNGFLDMMLKHKPTGKKKKDNLGCIKIKTFVRQRTLSRK